MEGGTTFHFVTDGIDAALERAQEAAGHQDIRLGGGVATLRQYLRAKLIDEMHLALAPSAAWLLVVSPSGPPSPKLGYQCTQYLPTPPSVTHVLLKKLL